MPNIKGTKPKKQTVLNRSASILVILLNAVLLAGAFLFYALYTEAYEDRLRAENLGNITNLNQSAATNATSLFGNWNIKLNDIVRYSELHSLTRDQALTMIDETNSDNDRYFELIGGDYKGFLARRNIDGTFPALDYSSSSYAALQKIFNQEGAGDTPDDKILFAPEYTDGGESASKFFAIYKHLMLRDENGTSPYTLLLATRSKDVLAVINEQDDYFGQSTVLIDASGNYIVSNQDFKSANFFQFLYVYNNLTLDQKNAIKQEIQSNSSGELYYQNANAVVEDCVFRYERMDESGWYCITCVPISSFRTPAFNISYIIYAAAAILLLFIIDVMWLQSMNRRLRVSMRREKEASQAKGNFMSRMSHEIRTPLNAVIGYNTIARNEMSGAKDESALKRAEMKVMDCLIKSDIASKHLLTIINDVLDMSAIESGRIKVARDRFDFKGLITSLTTIFYSQAKTKGVSFEVIFDTMTEEWFVGDQMRTNQILTNLLSNAVKFTPEGGSVKLKILQPEADSNASHIHFEVSDTGIGMSKDYLSHLWTPFEQADSSIARRFGGTGLGLSITKNLVELMGGSITVSSELNVGTKFCVDLTFERTEQPKKFDSYDFATIKALIVDDDPSTCDYIQLLFQRCGARCDAVTSGERAIEAFITSVDSDDPYTLCLVDWRMQQMDGIETIRRIRSVYGGNVPMIVITAYDYTELADSVSEIGVSRFIAKPLFQSSLFDLLASLTGAQSKDRSSRGQGYNFEGRRVLLAEDNAMNMEIAKNILESAGLFVDGVWNGKEAVERFEMSKPGTYMLILMDVHMPEMNGHEAARAIRSSSHPESETIPIIAMTADAFAENVAEALEAGMNDHIAKPIDMQVLFSTLQKYASGNKK